VQYSLEPFQPSPSNPFDRAAAAHLARRAGFGATPEQIERWVSIGPQRSVDRYVDFPEVDEALEEELERLGTEFREPTGGDAGPATRRVRRWWIYRMVRGRFPLQENLTLFWHNHFASQESKVVRAVMLLRQNQLFRKLAGAPFGELLRGVAYDAAMLQYLDNRLSVKENPNENWARELMELFTLGVDRYTQRDVVELSRIFTGWSTPTDDSPDFLFNADDHDTGDKVLLGQTIRGVTGDGGTAEGEQALDLLVARDDCARFISRKLIGWFVSHDPSKELVDALASRLREVGFSIREGVRTLLGSEAFFDPANRRQRYRSPIDMVVGASRALDIQNPHLVNLDSYTERMGMRLFEPPSVAGWRLGSAWASSAVVLPRVSFGLALSELPHSRRTVTGRPAINLDRIIGKIGGADGTTDHDPLGTLIDRVTQHLLSKGLGAERRESLRSYLADAVRRQGGAPNYRKLVRGLIHLVVSSPEYAVE